MSTPPPFDRVYVDCNLATMNAAPNDPYGTIHDGALATTGNHISWVGPRSELPGHRKPTCSLDGAWITPGLIDCHTHVVFAGNRADEFEARLEGKSYEQISREGGGILSTVAATRAASLEDLVSQSLPRALALRQSGVTTVEIKSGYGLDLESELKMLRAAKLVGEAADMSVVATCLGAHTVAPEYRGRPDDYVEFLCETLLPAVRAEQLASSVDAYCESIAFSPAQVERVFKSAQDLGFALKLHADQLTDLGGAALAARMNALSADHLEHTNEDGVKAMANAGTTAVLLPGAFHFLREERVPPVDQLRKHGVPIAIATDCNPGTSPITSILLAMHLATVHFRMTPSETMHGTTTAAARALGLGDRGQLKVGQRADLAMWSVDHPRDLSYWAGNNPLIHCAMAGRD